jgi:hypothetical protein
MDRLFKDLKHAHVTICQQELKQGDVTMEIRLFKHDVSNPVIIRTGGNLNLHTWDQEEVGVRADPHTLSANEQEDGSLELHAGANLEVSLIHHALVNIEHVGASAHIEGLQGSLHMDKVGGRLTVVNCTNLAMDKVGGSFHAEKINGSVHVDKVGGSSHLKQINGELRIDKTGGSLIASEINGQVDAEKVGGSLYATSVNGELNVNKVGGDIEVLTPVHSMNLRAGGDIRINFLQGVPGEMHLSAGGDVELHIPQGTGANLIVSCDEMRLDLQSGKQSFEDVSPDFRHTIGTGGSELWPEIWIKAGGDVFINDSKPLDLEVEEMVNESQEDFGNWDFSFGSFEEFGQMAEKFAERATKMGERIGERVARKMERRFGNRDFFNENDSFHMHQPPMSSHSPVTGGAEKEPISDEEYQLILGMLQEKKISVEEANALLKSLGGNKDI